jgi:PTH1 family peptidyl-tRNA hydrolase
MSRLGRIVAAFRSTSVRKDGAPPPGPRHQMRWVIAGLGNPGDQYHWSRHNIGFLVVEHLAETHHAEFQRRKFKGLLADLRLGGESALLVKPQTYYNLSGECVAAVLGYYKIPAERLIVVHDELDLKFGQLRLKRGGSDAGNRGVRSIAAALGTPEFVRVRVGIGHHAPAEDAKDYVLHVLRGRQREEYTALIARAAEAVEAVISTGLERAMNVYNQRL